MVSTTHLHMTGFGHTPCSDVIITVHTIWVMEIFFCSRGQRQCCSVDVKVMEGGLSADVNKIEQAAFQWGSSSVSAANQGWVTEQPRWGGITCVRYFPHRRSSHTATSLLSSLLFPGPVYSCAALLGLESVPGCSLPPPLRDRKKRQWFWSCSMLHRSHPLWKDTFYDCIPLAFQLNACVCGNARNAKI